MTREHIEEFKQVRGKYRGIVEASKNVDSEDLGKRQQARGLANMLSGEFTGTGINPDNAHEVDRAFALGVEGYNRISTQYFDENREAIFAEIDSASLAEKYLAIPPVEIGEELHDKTVEAHKNFLSLQTLLQRYQESNSEVGIRNIAAAAIEYLPEHIRTHQESHKYARFLDDEFKELCANSVIEVIQSDPKRSLPIYAGMLNSAKDALDARFPNGDSDKSLYARRNVEALADQDKDTALDVIYSI